MFRARPPRPNVPGPRVRANEVPRVMLLCEKEKSGVGLRSELMRLLREPWFSLFQSIDDYRDSYDGNIIHDLIVYCSVTAEPPEAVRQAVNRIMLLCPEAKIILYSANKTPPVEPRLVAIVNQPNVKGLAETIDRLLHPQTV